MYSSYTSTHSDLFMLLGEVLMEYVNDFENRKKCFKDAHYWPNLFLLWTILLSNSKTLKTKLANYIFSLLLKEQNLDVSLNGPLIAMQLKINTLFYNGFNDFDDLFVHSVVTF